jgi:PAS domain S-box-containing protein
MKSLDKPKPSGHPYSAYGKDFLQLANLLPETVFTTDTNGALTYINQTGERMFGYSADLLTGESPEIFIAPQDRSRLKVALKKCLQGLKPSVREYAGLKQDSRAFPVQVHMRPIAKDGGRKGLIGLIVDLSEYKFLQEKLSAAQQREHYIFENMSDYWVLCDFDGNFIESSIAYRKDYNVSKDELVGLNIMDFLHADMREGVLAGLEEIRLKGKLASLSPVKLKDGDERNFACRSMAMYNDAKPVAAMILAWDVTESVRNKKALEASESRYRGVFENTGLPMIILEQDLLITMVNARFEELSGYSKNEIEGKMNISQFVADNAKENITKLFLDRTEDKSSAYECCVTNRGKEIFDMIVRCGIISSTRQMIASFTDITKRKQTETELLQNRDHLQKEVSLLRSSLKECFRFGDIIGKSQAMQEVYEAILKAAGAKANVIIYGESGTGKELTAQAIHQMSSREQNKFVTVNCGAIPESIIESEFFGYKKGAFTGAHADKLGYLDFADGGTLFLDEVGELSLNMQVKLLRVIDGGCFIPLGSLENRKTDVRIIAATHRNLRDLIKGRAMREDFFYRVHIIPIYLPPLRERKEDIPLLIDHFVKRYGGDCPPITGKILDQFLGYDWPGNVRELQNVVHRYLYMNKIDFSGSPKTQRRVGRARTQSPKAEDMLTMMESYEREVIENALARCRWNRTQAAVALGINRKTLFIKMNKYGLLQPHTGVLKPHK